ncbi:hypothetical protein AUC61_13395 [Pseudomonas sp. S25]|uniref:Glycosyltransferase 2-like domain-containing protein n=1 Tax=Pseudomonas maioricensis TaxID=1766623 RepID=A0ABS9ZIZ7_9PSED|nr:glycosyltransferase [Pseudomonas sp. S25]MCI8210530.1 hypothetical protein [Pseudomonas sp. S25]
MVRSLFAKRPHPYYIMAPAYRRNSAGIRVLHMLCDALIRSGHEAYVTTTGVPAHLMTPVLTQNTMGEHKAAGIEPIVVIPEVIDGNPLNSNVVVRYLLNQPGFLSPVSDYEPTDIQFAYTKALLPPGHPEDHVLYLPPVDLSIFRLSDNPAKRIAGKVAYFRGKSGKGYIDPDLLPAGAVEVTLLSPGSWEELADLFQQCEYFYCTEATGIGAEAVLCGCITVVLPNERAPLQLAVHENKGYGVAWGNTPELIERARETLPLFRASLLKHQEAFWLALDNFIEVTQKAAQDFTARNRRFEVLPWLADRALSAPRQALIDQQFASVPVPVIGVVVLDPAGDAVKRSKTLDSLARQAPAHVEVRPLVLSSAEGVGEFRFDPETYVASINSALHELVCDWFMVVQAGEEFTSSGLFATGLELACQSGHRAVYADEIVLKSDGQREFLLRPDLNLDLLLSSPAMLMQHWIFRHETWREQGGFVSDCFGAFELEYILRLIESTGFEGLGHISEPLVISAPTVLADDPQQVQVIERHLRARGFAQAQVNSLSAGCYQIDYGQPQTAGVSILVLVDGRLAAAQRCLESLLENTTYGNYELLVLDGGNDDPAVSGWLEGIEQLGVAHIRVLRYGAGLTSESLLSMAAQDAQGEFVLFLDSGVGIVGQDWLQQMLNHGLRPEVGSVGAKLVNGEGKLRHGGLLLGLNGPADVLFKGSEASSPGYMQRLQVESDFSALSEQCLLVKRELFLAAGGFDEQMAPWAHVDLCLKMQQAGYLNVLTPRVQMLISEPDSVAPTVQEEDRFYARWLSQLAAEPAYNPNYSLNPKRLFKVVESSLTWRPLAGLSDLKRVLAQPGVETRSHEYRLAQPFNAMRDKGLIDGAVVPELLSAVELQRFDPDVIVLQRQLGDSQREAMRRMKAFSRAFKVYEQGEYLSADLTDALRSRLGFMDRLVVSSDALANIFDGFHSDIRIIESRLDPRWWSTLRSERRHSAKPRIGLSGDSMSSADVDMVADVIRELADEVEWIFLGDCPEALRPLFHEVHSNVAIAEYPARLASLNLDLALAPLVDNLFNRCKSNTTLLEFGICGVPVICSDLEPYRCGLPVTRVKSAEGDWLDAVRAHLSDLEGAAAMGSALRSAVRRDWMLDDGQLQNWRDIWLPD